MNDEFDDIGDMKDMEGEPPPVVRNSRRDLENILRGIGVPSVSSSPGPDGLYVYGYVRYGHPLPPRQDLERALDDWGLRNYKSTIGFNEMTGGVHFTVPWKVVTQALESLESDDLGDMKEFDRDPQEADDPVAWANRWLFQDPSTNSWTIPGTRYDPQRPGSVEQANFVAMQRRYPWLKVDKSFNRLYLPMDFIDSIPDWYTFVEDAEKCYQDEVLDLGVMEEVTSDAMRWVWKDELRTRFENVLADKFQDRFNTPNWENDLRAFMHSDRGFGFFCDEADRADVSWDTDTPPPGIDADEVAAAVPWKRLKDAMYPVQDQMELGIQEGEEDEWMSDMMKDRGPVADVDEINQWLDDEVSLDKSSGMYELASYSDFSGTCADRANARYWVRTYPDLVSKYSGRMGTVAIGIYPDDVDEMDAEMFENIKADIAFLENNVVFDMDDLYAVEREQQLKAWNSWIKRDVLRSLSRRFPEQEDEISDFLDTDKGFAMFDDARVNQGLEWHEQSGGEQGVDSTRIADGIDAGDLDWWMHGQLQLPLDESEHKFSCVMAPAPDDMASAVLSWGQMYVLDDEVYEEEGFGRETDVHVTVKYGLHDAVPTPELLKIIEETPPFEIEVGPASLFEAEAYDVLKFDVESEALRELNARISELPCTDTHPEYHPHITVSYVQKGACRDLVGKSIFEVDAPNQLRYLVKTIVFSGKNDDSEKISLFLGKPNVEAVDYAYV